MVELSDLEILELREDGDPDWVTVTPPEGVGKMAVFRCQPSRASLVGRHRQGEQGDRQ
jgi:hypothetical protein